MVWASVSGVRWYAISSFIFWLGVVMMVLSVMRVRMLRLREEQQRRGDVRLGASGARNPREAGPSVERRQRGQGP